MQLPNPTIRRRVASIVGVMAAIAIGWAIWWAVPCELTLDVRVPEGTKSDYLAAMVLGRQADRSVKILQDWMVVFPDRVARSTSFRARLPRGDYRIVVMCDNTDQVDQWIRLGTSRTLLVPLTAHPGHDGRTVQMP
jgi:hypothetical protein